MRKIMPFVIGFLVAAVISGALAFLAIAANQPPRTLDFLPGALIGMVTTILLVSLGGNRKVVFASSTLGEAGLEV